MVIEQEAFSMRLPRGFFHEVTFQFERKAMWKKTFKVTLKE